MDPFFPRSVQYGPINQSINQTDDKLALPITQTPIRIRLFFKALPDTNRMAYNKTLLLSRKRNRKQGHST
jgi:hypothetical protein